MTAFSFVNTDFTQTWSKEVNTAYGEVTESITPLTQLQEPAKPKPEIVCNEADSSSASPERVPPVKNYVRAPFLKRKIRWEKYWVGNDSELSSLSKRRKPDSHEKREKEDSRHQGGWIEKSTKADAISNGSVDNSESLKAGAPSTWCSKPPARIVSDLKGRSLQITILQGQFSRVP